MDFELWEMPLPERPCQDLILLPFVRQCLTNQNIIMKLFVFRL